MLPSVSELEYFLEIANTLNMSRAADRLGISQPALTLAIQRLENNFGQTVLLRGKTGVRLTRAGEKLAVQARLLRSEWEKIRTDVSKDEKEIIGRYSIGCHPSVALYSLPHFLPQLLAANPRLDIKLTHDLSRKVTEDVISFKTDFGIVVNPPLHPELVIKNLFNDEVALWGSSNGFTNERVLILDPDLLQSQALLKQIEKKGMSFDRLLTSSNLEVITALAAAGAGVGIIPTRVAERLKTLGLKRYSDDIFFQDKICLVYRSDVQKTKASREIAERIVTSLKGRS